MIVRVMVLVPRNSIDKKRFIGQSVANHDLFFSSARLFIVEELALLA